MAWSAPMTFVDGAALTAAQLNTYLRNNMNETEGAKAANKHGLLISSGPNRIVERLGGSHLVEAAETSTSTSYTDLTTVGPIIKCNTGTRALFFGAVLMSANAANVAIEVGLQVSGQTTKSATGNTLLTMDGFAVDTPNRFTNCGFFEDLVEGENTFTLKYRIPSGNTATFSQRTLTVIPF